MSSILSDTDEDKLFQTYLGISKQQFQHQTQKPLGYLSKKPFECLQCNKTVALTQYLTHFKSEHSQIKCHNVERNENLVLPFVVSGICYNSNNCLARITVYDVNRLLTSSGSVSSVIKTCQKFCLKTPLDSFWLMVAAVPQSNNYCIFWLFTTSHEEYKCTIELNNDSKAFTVKCNVANALDKDNLGFADIQHRVQGLVLTRNQIISFLKGGLMVNLRVVIH